MKNIKMKELTIYCVHPISGQSADDVFEYYEETYQVLKDYYNVFIPMIGKQSLRTELKFKSEGYKNDPLTKNHAIFERDKWMVTKSDIIYANLIGTKIASIGSIMELAWASMLGKYIILIMEQNNIHRHAFVLEAADVIFEEEKLAIDYLLKLAKKEI
jgi:nucleoside 2-deoxyribosyltransferase